MLPDGRRLGAHLPLATGMVHAVERAHAIGAAALQIFADNPTAWRRRAEPPAGLEAFRARLAALDISPLAIHASYLVNLAGPEPGLYERSVTLLADEMRAAPDFGARFVNVHIGSHRDTSVAAGTVRLADAIARVLAAVDDEGEERSAGAPAGAGKAPMLVLENSAGSGFGMGIDIDELSGIAKAISTRGLADDRVGFCIDTAHAWSAGIDLGSPEATDVFLRAFDERIGLERLVMIHLNDSRSELGSRIDRHEHLGAGRIGTTGLRHVLIHPALAHVAYYLETPGMDEGYDAVNIARALDIAAGRPLADLPPEAFAVRSSGSRVGRAARHAASDEDEASPEPV